MRYETTTRPLSVERENSLNGGQWKLLKISLHLNNSLNHSKLNELLPRHQQFDRAVFQAQSA
jgi:hypothetical protein